MTTFILSVCVVRTVDHVFSDRDLKKGFERLRSKDWWASHWKQAQRQTSANGDATGTDDKDTIHLMLPIWVRRAKRAWYTEDDPQWKANQSFAKDKKRRNEVAHKIVALVGEQLQNDAYLPWVKYLQALNVTMDMDLILPISLQHTMKCLVYSYRHQGISHMAGDGYLTVSAPRWIAFSIL